MTSDFEATANQNGAIQRAEVKGVIAALRLTIRTTTSGAELLNAKLMLERLGETMHE